MRTSTAVKHLLPACCHAQVFNVPGRCYPVDIIHSQEDHMQDYTAAAIDTALQIHLNQPEGERPGQASMQPAITHAYGAVSSCETPGHVSTQCQKHANPLHVCYGSCRSQ